MKTFLWRKNFLTFKTSSWIKRTRSRYYLDCLSILSRKLSSAFLHFFSILFRLQETFYSQWMIKFLQLFQAKDSIVRIEEFATCQYFSTLSTGSTFTYNIDQKGSWTRFSYSSLAKMFILFSTLIIRPPQNVTSDSYAIQLQIEHWTDCSNRSPIDCCERLPLPCLFSESLIKQKSWRLGKNECHHW